MLKPEKVSVSRIPSMSTTGIDRAVFVSSILAMFVGFFIQGPLGIAHALMLLVLAGLLLQVNRRVAKPDSVLASVTRKCSIPFSTYTFGAVGTSIIILMTMRGPDLAITVLGWWAAILCGISCLVKFTPKQWRGIAIGGSLVVFAYIAQVSINFFGIALQLALTPRAATGLEPIPYLFGVLGILSLACITMTLAFLGRIAHSISAKTACFIGAANSTRQRIASNVWRCFKQWVAELPVYAFLGWYLSLVFFISFPVGSVGEYFGNWISTSFNDANIGDCRQLSPYLEDFLRKKQPPNTKERLMSLLGYTLQEQRVDKVVHTYTVPVIFRDAFAGSGASKGLTKVYSDGQLQTKVEDATKMNAAELTLDGRTLIVPVGDKRFDWYMGVDSPYPYDCVRNTLLLCKVILALGLIVFPFPILIRGAALYASMTRRFMGYTGNLRLSETALATLRNTGAKLRLKYESRFAAQAAATFWWLFFWYAAVFLLVAFVPGNFGQAIVNWLDCSITDAGFKANYLVGEHQNMRIFLGALIAMYVSGPLACTGCVFLPHKSGRQIIVDEDGISVPDGPYFSMWLRTFRLYSDVKAVSLKGKSENNVEHDKDKRRIKIAFRTGGALSFRVMDVPPEDLKVLLERIDEHVEDCSISAEIVELRVKLAKDSEVNSTSDSSTRKGKFKSSIFVPFVGGESIEGHDLRIVKVLANKPLSAVYLVRTSPGKLAVLKQLVMPKDDESAREHLRIFQRECELMKEFQHNGIAKVLDVFSIENHHYLLLEHFKGSDLKSVVESYGARSIDDVAAWGLHICDVLEYLHSREIVHRDITPENIVLGENNSVRLIDFGAAHQFMEGITGTLIGKQSYVAPEQLRGKATKRSDIYSLGVTMNYLLTAKDPVALMQCEPELGAGNSALLMRTLIMAMTNFDEEKRPESIDVVRKVLLSVLNRSVQPKLRADALDSDRLPVAGEAPPVADEVAKNEHSEETEASVVKTIQLMAESLPEEALVINTGRKKAKVKSKTSIEKK